MTDLRGIASLAILSLGYGGLIEATDTTTGQKWRGRRDPIPHTETEKPLSKRVRRRNRGKGKP